MIKVGDLVMVIDMDCVNHRDTEGGFVTCCNHDFSEPVRVVHIEEDTAYPYEVEVISNGREILCPFSLEDLRKV